MAASRHRAARGVGPYRVRHSDASPQLHEGRDLESPACYTPCRPLRSRDAEGPAPALSAANWTDIGYPPATERGRADSHWKPLTIVSHDSGDWGDIRLARHSRRQGEIRQVLR